MPREADRVTSEEQHRSPDHHTDDGSGQTIERTRASSEFSQAGVVHIPGFLKPDDVATLVSHMEAVVDRRTDAAPDVAFVRGAARAGGGFRVIEDIGNEPALAAWGRSAHLMATAAELLGEPVAPAVSDELSSFGWQALFNLEPGSDDWTPPHQDNRYYNFDPPVVLALWIALDPVSPDNGGLRYLRGSHRGGLRPHRPGESAGFSLTVADFGPEDIAGAVSFDLAPGDLVAHHGLTVHWAEPNTSAHRRWGYSLVYRAARCHRDPAAHARYVTDLERHNRRFAG
jgi:phytanoyl-CoA hydroxylase